MRIDDEPERSQILTTILSRLENLDITTLMDILDFLDGYI